MAKQKRQPESFDVSEFLRPTDEDLKSALTSLLRDGSSFDPPSVETQVDTNSITNTASPNNSQSNIVAEMVEDESLPDSISLSDNVVKDTVGLPSDFTSLEPSRTKNIPDSRPYKRGITPVDKSFDLSFCLKRAKVAYRLNRTELVLYEMFLRWTHAVGKTRCEATNRKICEISGLIEKNVRRNLKSLRARGLVIQVKAYDPYTHEPSHYDVFLPPFAPNP